MSDLHADDDGGPGYNPEALEGVDAPDFNPQEAAKLLGLTDKQFKLAEALRKGANKTQAARVAGYAGGDEALRSAGSDAAKSEKVKSYLAWAEKAGAGQSPEPCDTKELKKILSRHARGDDKNTAVRAIEVLHRLNAADAEAARQNAEAGNPLATLDEIASIGPIGRLLAQELAASQGIDWTPDAAASLAARANTHTAANGNGSALTGPASNGARQEKNGRSAVIVEGAVFDTDPRNGGARGTTDDAVKTYLGQR